MNFQAKLNSSQSQIAKKGPPQQNSMMSSGPQPSTSTSSAGYNNILRGIARDSTSLNSAKASGQQNYQFSQSNNATVNGEVNSMSVSGVNEKLIYKATSGQTRGAPDNSSNGYLIKSAKNTVK